MTDARFAVIKRAEVIIIAAKRNENATAATANIRSAGIAVITFQIIDTTTRESRMVALPI